MVVSKVRYLVSQPAFQADPVGVLARLGWWWFRSRIPRPALVYLRDWELSLEIPPRWRGAAKLCYAFRERYEPELAVLPRFVRRGAQAVDVGACYGIYACVLGRLVGPEGKVYAFEPAREAFAFLARNVERNGMTWVEAHQWACADFVGEALLRHEPDPSRNALERSRSTAANDGERVRVVRLDDVVASADFVKLDVEGAEELVLRGAVRLLSKSRPVLLFEVNRSAAERLGASPEGAWELLTSFGYRFFQVQQDGQLAPTASPPAGGNVFGVPDR